MQINCNQEEKRIFFPSPLLPGDKIAMISPASVVKEEYVEGAMDKIRTRGYEPVLMQHAVGYSDGNFSATGGDRLIDLFTAIQDDEIKAILCNRGGYGCCQLLSKLTYNLIVNNPKWIIGFSDVSALLALWYNYGVASIHGPMAKHLASNPLQDSCSDALFTMLENGGRFDYEFPGHEYNRCGKVKGVLRGGNMAVLNDLVNTPYDILSLKNKQEGIILFLEDISEPIYKVNRMLWRLLLSGSLTRLKGIIFGRFTEYKPDKNFSSMEDMIHCFLKNCDLPSEIPVVYDFPVGHSDLNYPLTEGANVELEVTNKKVRLRTLF